MSIKTDNKGFTLLELMVAMVIFALGLLAMGSLQIQAMGSNRAAHCMTEAPTPPQPTGTLSHGRWWTGPRM